MITLKVSGHCVSVCVFVSIVFVRFGVVGVCAETESESFTAPHKWNATTTPIGKHRIRKSINNKNKKNGGMLFYKNISGHVLERSMK